MGYVCIQGGMLGTRASEHTPAMSEMISSYSVGSDSSSRVAMLASRSTVVGAVLMCGLGGPAATAGAGDASITSAGPC